MSFAILAQERPVRRFALALALFTLIPAANLHAVPPVGPTPEPATTNGNGTVTRRGRQNMNANGMHIQNDEPLVTDMTQEVLERLQREGQQWIHGREGEVEELSVKLAGSPSKTVVIEGNPQTGRTGVMEEWIRVNPDAHVFRLNISKLALMGSVEASVAFKTELARLARENSKASGSHKVVLFIDNLAALEKGDPPIVRTLWELVQGGNNLFKVIESHESTTTTQVRKNTTYTNLNEIVEVMGVKPPEYNMVYDFLLRNKPAYETSKVKISLAAIEEIARLAVKEYPTDAFRQARLIAEGAVRLVTQEQNAGASTAVQQNVELGRLKLQRSSLGEDLQAEADPASKKTLTAQLAAIDAKIEALNSQHVAATTPSGNRQHYRLLEINLAATHAALQGEEKSFSVLQRSSEVSKQLNRKIEEIVHRMHVLEEEMLLSSTQDGKPASRVGKDQVLQVVARMTNKTKARLQANFQEGINRIEEIKKIVVGQDHVIDTLKARLMVSQTHLEDGRDLHSKEVDLIKKGLLRGTHRPIGSFWFAGTTGVGKTETAKQLADLLGYDVIRFDMSEYMQAHDVSKLLGSPPGYVGSDEIGRLANEVRKNPECILLFDEIEKADPAIFNIFLQILDEGRLTDNKGKTVSFSKTIVVFTSNLAQEVGTWDRQTAINFLKNTGKWDDNKINSMTKYELARLRREAYKIYVTDPDLAREKGFKPIKPEILARLDEVLVFNNLTLNEVVKIAMKSAKQLANRMKVVWNVDLKFSTSTLTELLGYYNDKQGGRSVRDAFFNFLRRPIAELVIQNGVSDGDTLLVGFDESRQTLEFQKTTPTGLEEAKAKTQTLPEQAALMDRLIAKRAGDSGNRAARAATSELVTKVFAESPESAKLMVNERVFRFFKGK